MTIIGRSPSWLEAAPAQGAAMVERASREDASFLAWAILTAARSHLVKGWFDIVLNRPENDCLDFVQRLTVTQTLSWWHYSRFRVVEAHGTPVAALAAFRAGDAYPLSQQAMAEVAHGLGCDETEQQAMWQRGSYIFTCTLETDDNVWAIENVATLPEHRGRGFAVALLKYVVGEGRRNQLQHAQITFQIGNEAAERAYARAGFKFNDEKRDPAFERVTGAPGLRRYMRDL
jgi:GNAT superfamily N-acetyltransferase